MNGMEYVHAIVVVQICERGRGVYGNTSHDN